jgi:hypothetical protein
MVLGPRNLSGWSAENNLMRLPLTSVISPIERFHFSMHAGGIAHKSPLSPSTQVSRASAYVGAMTPQRTFGFHNT